MRRGLGTDGPAQSPVILGRLPDAGVRRLNKVPLAMALGVGVTVVGVLGYTVMERAETARKRAEARQKVESEAPEAANPDDVLRDVPEDLRGILSRKGGPASRGEPPSAGAEALPALDDGGAPRIVPAIARSGAGPDRLEEERQRKLFAALENALTADTAVARNARRPQDAPAADAELDRYGHGGGEGRRPGLLAHSGGRGLGAGAEDPNLQAEKRSFLQEAGAAPGDHYLKASRTRPISPYELKQGTIIPAVMIGGVNSDLPGQLLAQVRENVWDTATGQYLLIPQGAKLVGTYDSRIAVGQERVLVAWTRVVFPDASALDLAGMAGADESGYAGFRDKVNNHYFKAFSGSILLSLFGAGAQLSQPRPRADETISAGEIAAAQLGQQTSQLGMELARRNLRIQPTLEVRPGYPFHVQVTRDIVLEPWVE